MSRILAKIQTHAELIADVLAIILAPIVGPLAGLQIAVSETRKRFRARLS